VIGLAAIVAGYVLVVGAVLGAMVSECFNAG
jgi:hypothetical protein